MDTQTLIKEFFKAPLITKYTTSYILFYQISLGSYVYESFDDIELTKNKLQELHLALEPNKVIIDIFLLALESLKFPDPFEKLEQLFKKQALTKSLEDFITNDHELLNKENYKLLKMEQIQNNTLFNSNLKIQFLKEYPILYKDYEKVITDQYTNEVKQILVRNILGQ